MKRLSLLILPVLLFMTGCASIFTNPAPGSTVAEVIALKGKPDAQYQEGTISSYGILSVCNELETDQQT